MSGYEALYEIPACRSCGDALVVDRVRISRFEVFCANEECGRFVQAFWIDKVRRGR